MIDIFFLFIQVYAGVLCYVTLIWLISLYLKDSSIVNWNLSRRIFSKLANLLARKLLNIQLTDFTNGGISGKGVNRLLLNGNANWTTATTGDTISFVYNDGMWIETNRSDNT